MIEACCGEVGAGEPGNSARFKLDGEGTIFWAEGATRSAGTEEGEVGEPAEVEEEGAGEDEEAGAENAEGEEVAEDELPAPARQISSNLAAKFLIEGPFTNSRTGTVRQSVLSTHTFKSTAIIESKPSELIGVAKSILEAGIVMIVERVCCRAFSKRARAIARSVRAKVVANNSLSALFFAEVAEEAAAFTAVEL